MKDKFLSYYNKELSYFRQYSQDFAKKHPKVAGNLGVDDNDIEDPHVARLIEAVSFLTARVQQNIDSGLPELTQSMFSILYPDYFAPIPATGVFSFGLKDGVNTPYTIEKGERFRAIQSGMTECRFRTCYETTLYPIKISKVNYTGLPFDLPEKVIQQSQGLASRKTKIQSKLKIEVATTSSGLDDDGFTVENLRCYLKGQQQYIAKLFDLIHDDCIIMTVNDKHNFEEPEILNVDQIKKVGFSEDEAVLPYEQKSFSGFRTLSEFYHIPEKFMFFDIEHFGQRYNNQVTNKELTFYCKTHYSELEQYLKPDNFILGASAAINLFEHIPELIDVEPLINDYNVNPSASLPDSYEVHHIKAVNSIDAAGNKDSLQPIYKPNVNKEKSWVWNYQRHYNELSGGKRSAGIETSVTLIEQGDARQPRPKFLQLITECSNRNLPTKLRLNEGGCQLLFSKPTPTISTIKCQSSLTKPKRPRVSDKSRWQLARHLNLSYLSDQGLDGLKEVLALYNLFELPEVENMIDGIQSMSIVPSVSRAVIGGHSGVIHGNEVTLICDEEYYTGTSIYFFGCIINSFLSQLCQVNSFVKLSIRLQGHRDKVYQWPVLNGKVKLL